MTKKPALSPGTVSQILWHFTGGPTWNSELKRQGKAAKPAARAYANLRSILADRQLRLGKYKEVVHVKIQRRVRHGMWEDKRQTKGEYEEVRESIESSSICCVSDIPTAHLQYHAQRYGKFAVGFHRDSVIRAGFNPVFYTLHDTPIIRSMYEGFSSLRAADVYQIQYAAEDIENRLKGAVDEAKADLAWSLRDIEFASDDLERVISDARASLEDFVAFVKSFEPGEFNSIYCEREWRSTRSFSFEPDDIAMVVVPRTVGKRSYFRPFVERVAPKLRLPRRIPIVPWEDLVEH